MTQTPAELLESAAENAVAAFDPGIPIEHHARRLISEETELIEALTPVWQLREVMRILRAKRSDLSRRHREQEQYLLPGFERLPMRIAGLDGRRNQLANATYKELRAYLAVLHKRHRDNAQITQVKALLELVEKYKHKTPKITVREVCEKEAAR